MYKLLLVANRGSFSRHASQVLSLHFNNLFIVYTDIVETAILKANFSLLNFFDDNNIDKSFDVVVYIGGEVRDEAFMLLRNYTVPSIFSNYCSDKGIRFIYLSSLSVYGDMGNMRLVSETTEPGTPDSEYSRTKRKFDLHVEKRNLDSGYVAIQPSSIIGSNRLNSSLDRVIFMLLKYRWLKYVEFSTMISFIDRGEILDFIVRTLSHKEMKGAFILSHNATISQIQKNIYKKKFKPFFDACVVLEVVQKVFFFIGRIVRYQRFNQTIGVLRNLTNKTQYQSEYCKEQKSGVEDYISKRCQTIKEIFLGK